MEQIRGNWRGEASDQFMTKGGVLENDLRDSITEIRKVAASIRDKAAAVEKVQMQAKEIINRKNT